MSNSESKKAKAFEKPLRAALSVCIPGLHRAAQGKSPPGSTAKHQGFTGLDRKAQALRCVFPNPVHSARTGGDFPGMLPEGDLQSAGRCSRE